MIEYWAVIGLASLDSSFRETLQRAANIGLDAQDMDTLTARTGFPVPVGRIPAPGQGDVEFFLATHGFRLSRYETGEVTRLMRISDVVNAMTNLHNAEWIQGRTCWTAKTFNDKYRHPVETALLDQAGIPIQNAEGRPDVRVDEVDMYAPE